MVAGAGVAGVVGFGLRTRQLERDYHSEPTSELRDEGLRMQALTNASLAVAGALLVALDLFVIRSGASDRIDAAEARGLTFSF